MKVLFGFGQSKALGGGKLVFDDRAEGEYTVEAVARGDAKGGSIYPIGPFLSQLADTAQGQGRLSEPDTALFKKMLNEQAGWFTKTVRLTRDEAMNLHGRSGVFMRALEDAANSAGWAGATDLVIDVTPKGYAGYGEYVASRGTTGLSEDAVANLDAQWEQWAKENAQWLLGLAKSLGLGLAATAILVGLVALGTLLAWKGGGK